MATQPTPSEAPKAVAIRRISKAPAPGETPQGHTTAGPSDVGIVSVDEPELNQPVTLLAIDPLGGKNQTFPSFDKSFLPLLSEFVTILAKSSRCVTGINVQSVPKSLTTRRGPKGKKVTATIVNLDIYAGSIQPGQEFDSAAAASQALGASYNSVHQALHRSNGQPVEVDGVTFEYSDEYMTRLNADVKGD